MDDKNTIDFKDTVFQPLNAFTYIFYFVHVQFLPCLAVTSFLQRLTISGSGPAKSSPLDSVNGNGEGERRIAVADFKGKFLVIIFFKNNDSKEFLKAFSDLADLFRGNKIEVWKHFQKIGKSLFTKKTYVWIFGVGPK